MNKYSAFGFAAIVSGLFVASAGALTSSSDEAPQAVPQRASVNAPAVQAVVISAKRLTPAERAEMLAQDAQQLAHAAAHRNIKSAG